MAIPASQSHQFDFDFEQEPYSYAAERALSEQERSVEELEAAVKETPTRSSMSLSNSPGRTSGSEPRAFGDVYDESEKMLPLGSPGLRHKKGRLEHTLSNRSSPMVESFADVVKHEPDSSPPPTPSKSVLRQKENVPPVEHESYASVVQHEPTSPAAVQQTQKESHLHQEQPQEHGQINGQQKEQLVIEDASHSAVAQDVSQQADDHAPQEKIDANPAASHAESYADIVKHEPTSPAIKPQETNGTHESKQEEDFADTATVVSDGTSNHVKNDSLTQVTEPVKKQDSNTQGEPGTLVYENFNSRSGTNLTSIVLDDEYDMAMHQAEIENPQKADEAPKSRLVSGRRAGAGWSRSPLVRWAPLNIPLQRRLQSLAVLAHSLSIAGLLSLFFVLCAIPIFWPILLPYLIYVLLSRAPTDGTLKLRSEWLRRSKFWSLFASYWPARLHRTVELEPTRKYIFGYHPHGIISHGAFAAFTTEALGFSHLFPGITNTLLTLDSNFRVPLYRDWALRLGLASVSRESCENLLSKGGPNGEGMGRAITIVVGGARESLDAKPGTLNLVLKRRKGFIKLAVRMGADLVPVLGFGENDMYEQIDSDAHPWIHKSQMFLKKFMGFTVPLFHARGLFNYDVGIFPYRRPINIVVGRPITTVQSKKPDPEYIDKLHQQYVDELLHIWEEWKDVFSPDRKEELKIIE